MLVGTDLKDIKYVAVEVIREGMTRASNTECGLYMGITKKVDKDKVEHDFLILVTGKAAIRMYNLDMYDVITVDAVDSASRYMTVFNKDDEDQRAAIELLKEITSELTEDKRLYVNDPNKEIIDVDTYKDYPVHILESDNITGSAASNTSQKSTAGSTGGGTNTNKAGTGTGTTSTTYTSTKQEPKVFSIKRKGKLPSLDKMEAMKDKVLRLASGDFELTMLPIPECDKDDKKTEPAQQYEEYTGPYC